MEGDTLVDRMRRVTPSQQSQTVFVLVESLVTSHWSLDCPLSRFQLPSTASACDSRLGVPPMDPYLLRYAASAEFELMTGTQYLHQHDSITSKSKVNYQLEREYC